MKIKTYEIKMLLQRMMKIVIYVIALFSVSLCFTTKVDAAYFEYKDFDFDTFYEENKTYWNTLCSNEGEEKLREICEKKLLKAQKKFYTRLYKILAKYQARGLFINDNIIIETVFFGLIASDFTDTSAEYKKDWNTYSNSYNFDDSFNDDDYSVDVDYSNEEAAQKYFENETDTLSTLIRNMIAYTTTCYGTHGNVVYVENEETGETYAKCPNGGTMMQLDYYRETQCADILSSFEYGFWEYYLSKYENDKQLGIFKPLAFLKIFRNDTRHDSCMSWGGGYKEMYYDYEDEPTVSVNRYFDFLKYNIFYDNKFHLQGHFRETVLIPAGAECMTKDLCGDKSLEAMDLYDEYEEEIYEVRTDINLWIIDILKDYGIDELTWGESPLLSTEEILNTAARNTYYWPIGSTETENRNGVTYADGDPISSNILRDFGAYTDENGESKFHTGIDIAGEKGSNVVATYGGEVVTVVNNCKEGDTTCGNGYGNHVIIAHSNGDYTLYAHLDTVDSAVKVGASVQQGQVIGTLGMTGDATTPHLHFEVRVGGNSSDYAVDPNDYLSSDDPRPTGASGDFSVKNTSLTKEEFKAKLVEYCNKNSCENEFRQVFVMNAGLVYDASIANNVNPELVVVRALAEGLSPGGRTNNYWGIGCYNGASSKECASYSSLSAGIAGFAKAVSGYTNTSDMMSRYSYIGDYWYNPGSWGLGGCPYFPYIRKYMPAARQTVAERACASNAPTCTKKGESSCTKTTSEDQTAYAKWQVDDKMSPLRYNIFDL